MPIEFCRQIHGRPHRVHTWIDIEKASPLYGVQAQVRRGKWAHVLTGNEPLLFETKAEAASRARELSKELS